MSVRSVGSTLSSVSDNSTIDYSGYLDSHYRSPDTLTTSSNSANPSTLEPTIPSIHADLCAQENANAQFIKNLPKLEVNQLLGPFRKGILESTSTLAVRDAITNEVKVIPGHQLIDVTRNQGMSAPSSHTYESVSTSAADNDFILPRANSSWRKVLVAASMRKKLFGSLIVAGILLAVVLAVVLILAFSGAKNENPGNSTSTARSSTGHYRVPTLEIESTPVTDGTTESMPTTDQSGGGGVQSKSSSTIYIPAITTSSTTSTAIISSSTTSTSIPSSSTSTTSTPHTTASDSKILIIGGSDGGAMSSMEMYNPFNPRLNHVIKVTMSQPRRLHSSALMDDGTVITTGGYDGSQYLSACERFDPSTSTVTSCPSLKTARSHHASSVLNGVLYVCGGLDGGDGYIESCERLHSNVWQDSIPMTSKRAEFAMVTLGGYLYAIGGLDAVSSVERRSATDQHWTTVKAMNNGRRSHSAVAMGGKIYVCGDNGAKSCESYDPIYNKWVNIASMVQGRRGFGLVSDGFNLFAVGGDPSRYLTVEMCNDKDGTWKIMEDELIYARQWFSAVLIESSKSLF